MLNCSWKGGDIMKKVKELFNRKLILSIISVLVIAGLSFVYISNTNKELKENEVYDLEVEEKEIEIIDGFVSFFLHFCVIVDRHNFDSE